MIDRSEGTQVPGRRAIAAAAVPLSSVRQPREDLGRAAIELLLDEVERKDEHTHRQVAFQPDVVVRESTSLRRSRSVPTKTVTGHSATGEPVLAP